MWKVSSFSQSSERQAVAWHPRQMADSWGRVRRPLNFAISSPSGLTSTAYAALCLECSHLPYWLPMPAVEWQPAQTRTPTYTGFLGAAHSAAQLTASNNAAAANRGIRFIARLRWFFAHPSVSGT